MNQRKKGTLRNTQHFVDNKKIGVVPHA